MTDDPGRAGVPAMRAQFLATEHWSLLATRSQTWSEVMGRITAQFTFASASLVVLALTLQVVGLNACSRSGWGFPCWSPGASPRYESATRASRT